jgi:hypothetical protein
MIDPQYVVSTVRKQAKDLGTFYKTLDILEGNLEPYVVDSLRRTLSPQVMKFAVERLMPINIFPRYVSKLSTIYQTGVMREVANGSDADSELLAWYEQQMNINTIMQSANKLYTSCRSTLIHPYITDEGPRIRAVPNDRFVLCSDDPIEPTKPTMAILLAGQNSKGCVYWVYTQNEFAVVHEDESIDYAAMNEMGLGDGQNPYGVLPFVYVNSSDLRLRPVPDIDSIRMTEYIPIAFTDLNLAAMFASFSITYTKNTKIENMVYAPNAVWNLKSDDPDKDPDLGTIKPQVDYAEVIDLVETELSLWLDSKGIKAGSLGDVNGGNVSSGIAKVIDEADTYDVRQGQSLRFQMAEKHLWDLVLRYMHPVWTSQNLVSNRHQFSASASVTTKFALPIVGTQRMEAIQEQQAEYAAGFTTRSRAIAALNPQMTMKEVEDLEMEIDMERGMPMEALDASQTSESSDQASRGADAGSDI